MSCSGRWVGGWLRPSPFAIELPGGWLYGMKRKRGVRDRGTYADPQIVLDDSRNRRLQPPQQTHLDELATDLGGREMLNFGVDIDPIVAAFASPWIDCRCRKRSPSR